MLVGARAVSAVALLVSTPLLLGMLGVREFGIWSLLVATVTVFGLADLGLGLAQTREIALAAETGERRRARIALALGLAVYFALAVVLMGVVLAAWPVFAHTFHIAQAPNDRIAALLLVTAFVVDVGTMPWRAALEGNQRMRRLA
ncbi:MAG TPA: oligosaccharide flippase family protein, partial [Gaiellaceae bacterium]|nr:oligosaccharide flippase family protein [Gaiellaceae bacterium]